MIPCTGGRLRAAALGSAVVMAVLTLAGCRVQPIVRPASASTAATVAPVATLELGTETGSFDLAQLQPAPGYDYWAWEAWWGEGGEASDRQERLAEGGRVARAALDPVVLAQLDAPAIPFGEGCPPGACFETLVAVRGDTVAWFGSAEQVAAFLTPVDTPADAAFLAYVTGVEPERIWETPTGYRVLGSNVVSAPETPDCAAFNWVTLLELLHISTSGAVTVLDSMPVMRECYAY